MNNNLFNLVASIILSVLIIIGWQYFYEKPRLEKITAQQNEYQKHVATLKKQSALSTEFNKSSNIDSPINAKRIKIISNNLNGSISLKGLRFDDLTLLKYKENLKSDEAVTLLSPSNEQNSYFAEIGWWGDKELDLPDLNTIWNANKDSIAPEETVVFSYKNKHNMLFEVEVSFDENYMFKISQRIINNSNMPASVQAYGIINRKYGESNEKLVNILHQGMISSVNSELNEYNYDKVKDEGRVKFAKKKIDWIGITDKYWLSAFIPDKSLEYNSNFSHAIKQGSDKYQADFVSSARLVESSSSFELNHMFFAGAKKVDLLDKYSEQYNISLFDRAIDFGWFYVLTKPIFHLMNYFYNYTHNFGISIMIVTVLIKLVMFSLANKSYRSMKKMKKLQPQIDRFREIHGDDKMRLNQEIMALYKKEQVNPVAGCLPILLQIPVFFSIYKVLYVTIEMRHSPFFGWINDLSAPDPTNIFNLFGLLPFTPPSMLHIGAWPIIMAITMFLQQKLSPQPTDPVQAQVIKFMPLIFLFMFAGFPAGLLIYWSWNNLLSITQQSVINKLDKS